MPLFRVLPFLKSKSDYDYCALFLCFKYNAQIFVLDLPQIFDEYYIRTRSIMQVFNYSLSLKYFCLLKLVP